MTCIATDSSTATDAVDSISHAVSHHSICHHQSVAVCRNACRINQSSRQPRRANSQSRRTVSHVAQSVTHACGQSAFNLSPSVQSRRQPSCKQSVTPHNHTVTSHSQSRMHAVSQHSICHHQSVAMHVTFGFVSNTTVALRHSQTVSHCGKDF